MLNKLLGALDSARHLLSSDAALLHKGLTGLDLIASGLAERAAHFVATGDNASVLQECQTPGRAGMYLGNPGRLQQNYYNGNNTDAEKAAISKSLAGRHALYERVDGANPEVGLLVRLGQVLEAVDGGQLLELTGAPMPGWLHYLLNDALWASYGDYSQGRKQDKRPAWDIELLVRIAEQEGLPASLPLQIVFERKLVDSYSVDHTYKRLLKEGPLDAYLLAHPEAVNALARDLSAAGRLQLCKRIGAAAPLRAAFAPLLARLAVADSKTVRAQASCYIDGMEPAQSLSLLSDLLRTGQTEERANAADLLARTMGDRAIPVLEETLAAETSKPVLQAIRAALSRLQAAGDAQDVELPAPPPMPPVPETRLGEDALALLLANRVELLERLRVGAEQEEEQNRTEKYKSTWQRDHYKRYAKLSEDDLRDAWLTLNGEREHGKKSAIAREGVAETLRLGGRLEARADFGMLQMLRWVTGAGRWRLWFHPVLQSWVRANDPQHIDLRQLASLAASLESDPLELGRACLQEAWGQQQPQDLLPPHRIWPYFVEHPELIDQGLGLAPVPAKMHGAPSLGGTLSVLACFPVIPARWLPRVMEYALGEGKTYRATAQQALSGLPDIGKRVCDALGSSKQELRIEAARWLARLDYRAGIDALYAALAKETRETASAAFMTALERLGEDMAPHLAPATLLAQAKKGLKGKAPAGLAWLNLDGLPPCRWQDGTPVEPEIIRWWVILACKLKEPGGNGLIERYLGLLDGPSRAALGSTLLFGFIARDTEHPPQDECIAYAQAHAAQRYQAYQDNAKRYPDYYGEKGKLTPEQVFEELKREKMAEYLGSAINEKGILALVGGTPGHAMVAAIAQYMRDHYQRRAQIEVLLEAACSSNEPAVIQFVLGIARRYRTASVQEKARMLVERIAERNGWTQDQLADRTIPTGGLDENGRMVLPYGSRSFTVVLDAAMKVTLQTGEGKVIAALPAPRADDAPESIKEGKAMLSTCKKELKQVVEMQTARLYDAMCAGRAWPVAEWRDYLQRHPIAGRLVQRLIWAAYDANGELMGLFRPTEDGSLIDTEDEEVELAGDGQVRLAHRTMLGQAEAAAWLAHCKDYKITPPFAQMTRALPPAAAHADDLSIADRLGWMSDTFTLRGAFGKLGYLRGYAEDGGIFFEYAKQFASSGIMVRIEFSGSCLPEENMPAALKALRFEPLGRAQYGQHGLPLSKVPPVLLAEAYGDYHTVAAACAGFDPQWQKKVPW